MKKLIILIPLLLTGCNKQVFDLNYDYNKVICNYGSTSFEIKIEKWNDYEGEQIQVISDGKSYLLSTNRCYMIGE